MFKTAGNKIIRAILFGAFLAAIHVPLKGQILISGKVLRAGGNQPIAYVNIGIVNTGVGTISDEDGSFSIKIPLRYTNAKLSLSALGYKPVSLPVDSIQKLSNITVYFNESVTQLNTVTVTGKRFAHKYDFGNEKSEGGSIYADTVTAGSAMALLIENKTFPQFKFPALVEHASVRIAKNTFEKFKVRIRIYDVDSLTGLPGKDLFNKSIVKHSAIKSGWLKINLLEHNIVVNGPFYLAFEWILDKRDRAYLHEQYMNWRRLHPELVTIEYSAVDGKDIPYLNYKGNFWAGTSFGIAVLPEILEQFKCYYRFSSFSEWSRGSSILAAKITLSN